MPLHEESQRFAPLHDKLPGLSRRFAFLRGIRNRIDPILQWWDDYKWEHMVRDLVRRRPRLASLVYELETAKERRDPKTALLARTRLSLLAEGIELDQPI